MASVQRRKDSPYWICCYRDKTGKRRQRSSRTTDKNEALRIACSLEGVGNRWERERAERIVQELAEAHGKNLFDPTLVSEYFSNWYNARSVTWERNTKRSFHAIHKQFVDKYGTQYLGKMEKRHLAEYRDLMTSHGRSPRNVRQHIKYIRRVFATAIEEERISDNPAFISLPKIGDSIKKPFSLSQFKALLNKTDGEWHLLILVAGLTGQRLNDVLALTADDFLDDKVRFSRQKNKDTHWMPRHPQIAGIPEVGPLFPELDALAKTGSRSVSAQFREDILPRIGIVQPYGEDLGGCRQVTKYSFHSFRHMLSTELNRVGASQETRMMIVGHDSKAVSKGYTHVDFQTALATLNRVAL